jgi:hypothetical protein
MCVLSSTANHLFSVSRNTGKTLQCMTCGSVRCENVNLNYREAWAIIDLSRVRLSVCESSLSAPKDAMSETDERRWWMLELVKSGKTAKEIEQLIALMYPPIPLTAVKPEH